MDPVCVFSLLTVCGHFLGSSFLLCYPFRWRVPFGAGCVQVTPAPSCMSFIASCSFHSCPCRLFCRARASVVGANGIALCGWVSGVLVPPVSNVSIRFVGQSVRCNQKKKKTQKTHKEMKTRACLRKVSVQGVLPPDKPLPVLPEVFVGEARFVVLGQQCWRLAIGTINTTKQPHSSSSAAVQWHNHRRNHGRPARDAKPTLLEARRSKAIVFDDTKTQETEEAVAETGRGAQPRRR